jgi:hypothetical protein
VLLSKGLEPLLHFLGREILFARGDVPEMSIRIGKLSGSVAVELILGSSYRRSSSLEAPLINGVDIFDVQVDADRRALAAK